MFKADIHLMRLLLFPFVLLAYSLSFAQHTLTIEIRNVRAQGGEILVAVYDSPDTWLSKNHLKFEGRAKAREGSVTITIPAIPHGSYGIALLHDRNSNEEMDTNLIGIPMEGYGFSRNPAGWRQPRFEDAVVQVGKNTRVVVEMRYW